MLILILIFVFIVILIITLFLILIIVRLTTENYYFSFLYYDFKLGFPSNLIFLFLLKIVVLND